MARGEHKSCFYLLWTELGESPISDFSPNCRVLIVLNMDVLGYHEPTIGNPVAVVESAVDAGAPQPQPYVQQGDQNIPPEHNAAGGQYGNGGMYGKPPNAAGPYGGGGSGAGGGSEPAPYSNNANGHGYQQNNAMQPNNGMGPGVNGPNNGPGYGNAPGPMYGAGPGPGPSYGGGGPQGPGGPGASYGAGTQYGGGAPGPGYGSGPAPNGPPSGGYGGGGPPAGGYGGGPGGMQGGGPAFNRQPAPHYGGGGGAVARNEAPARITPIAMLNSYNNRWCIKARVTSKSDMRRWNGVKGEGKLFSFDLLDGSGEIRATAFNDRADRFFNAVEVGRVYMLQKANLVPVKNRVSKVNGTSMLRVPLQFSVMCIAG